MEKEELLYKQSRKMNDSVARAIYEEYFGMLYSVSRRYTSNTDQAKDTLQDSFIKIFENIKKFEWKGKGSFVAWMKRIVINTSIKQYHQSKKQNTSSVDDFDLENIDGGDSANDDSFIELLLDANVTESALLELLSRLPEHFRIVFNMYAIEGLSHKEIAELLAISDKTSTTRLTRARKILREMILEQYTPKCVTPLKEKSL